MTSFLLRSAGCLLFALSGSLYAAPTVLTISPTPGSSVGSLTSVSITFSEPVAGVTASDLGVNGEPVTSVSGAGAGPYVFSFPQPPSGTVSFGWDADQEIAGIGTGALESPSGFGYTLADTIAPSFAPVRAASGAAQVAVFPTAGATAGVLTQASVTFDEPVVGVEATDLLINGVPADSVMGEAAGPYVFSFPAPAVGAVAFTWSTPHGVQDAAGNAFAGTGWTVTQAAGASAGSIIITEFLAGNGGTSVPVGSDADGVRDENWDLSPWIELQNTSTAAVNLLGWSLTDDVANPRLWTFPSVNMPAGGRLVVFASGKDRKPASGNLHTNFTLSLSGGNIALFSPNSPAAAPASAFLNYPVQRHDFSFGAQASNGVIRYFSPPSVTQGAYTPPTSDFNAPAATLPPAPVPQPNPDSTLTGVAAEPAMSVSRGFFNEPFALVMSSFTAGSTIRYTLDGSLPAATSPAFMGSLTISGTTVLRAAVFAPNFVPSRAVTHTYLFPAQVVNQASPPYAASTTDTTRPQPPAPGGTPLPIAWGVSTTFTAAQTIVGWPTGTATGANNLTAGYIPADYGMDPKVYADPTKYADSGAVDAVNGKTNLERINSALRRLPALSLVIKSADMFGHGTYGTQTSGAATPTAASATNAPGGPLYPNSHSSVKSDFTKACSLELLQPDGSTVFVSDAGVDLHGNASRDPFKNPKHGFTIRFKNKFGNGRLRARVFEDSPVEEWDKFVLRGDFGGSWLHQSGADGSPASSDAAQRPRGIRIREAFSKESFRDMGRVASHHRFCHLFINGVCWGSYELMEDQAEDFSASYLGGNKDEHDVIDQGKLKSGTWAAWSALKALIGWTNLADAQHASNTTTQPSAAEYAKAFTNSQYQQLKTLLDLPWFHDYMIWQTFAGHRDWATAASDAGATMKNVYFIRPKGGTFKAMPWDMENLLWHESEDRISGMTNFAIGATPTLTPPGNIHPRAKSNAEYRVEFADRAWYHLVRPNGALTPAECIARLDKWTAVVNQDAICLESARWGDYRYKTHPYNSGTVNQVYTWNGAWYDSNSTAWSAATGWPAGSTHKFNTGRTTPAQLGTYTGVSMSNAWWDEIRRLRTLYFPSRANALLTQYRTNGLYPFLNAPELRHQTSNALLADSTVPSGTLVKLVLPAAGSGSSSGEILYTLDGTDPRPAFDQTGTARSTAVVYTAPFAITQPTIVKARTRGTNTAFPSKTPVRAASTAVLTLTYAPTGGVSARGQITAAPLLVDGLTLVAGDRVLLKNQTISAQNGIWVVSSPGTGATGVWERATDWDADGEVIIGTWVRVLAGTSNTESYWRVNSPTGVIVVGGASGSSVGFATQQHSPWSALMEIVLGVGPAQPTVAMSEINYNPRSTQGGSAAEFVEIVNYGTLPVDVTSWSFSGVDFVFPATLVLAPSQRVVVASNNNPLDFASRFPGATPVGYFSGSLDNGSERLSLLDDEGRVVHSVAYSDSAPWPTAADNGGSSLEIVDPAQDAQNPGNWRASTTLNGTPGTPNTAATSTNLPSLTISEFHASGTGVDYVKLHNTGGSELNLQGWALEQSTVAGEQGRLPLGGLTLAAGERLLLSLAANNAYTLQQPLSLAGGSLLLRNAQNTVVDGVRYGPQAPSHAFFRDTTQPVNNRPWKLATPTATLAAATPILPEGASGLVVNEIVSNPAPSQRDWLEIHKNEGSLPSLLTGLSFEVAQSVHTISVPAAIAPEGYVRLWCDTGATEGDAINLQLPAAGGTVLLKSTDAVLIHSLTWSAQAQDAAHGLVDGQSGLQALPFPSPNLRNLLLTTPELKLSEVLVRNLNGPNTPRATREAWIEISNASSNPISLTNWKVRSIQASLPPVTHALAAGTVNSGAFVSLDSHTLGMDFDTPAYEHFGLELVSPTGHIHDRVTWGAQLADRSIGRLADGTWALLETPTRGAPNAAAHSLASVSGLKLNEWQSVSIGGAGEFLEVYNPAALPAHLGGLWLTDEPTIGGVRKTQVPHLTFLAAGAHLAFLPRGEISPLYAEGTPALPSTYSFRLDASGELIRLSANDAAATAIDAVVYPAVTDLALSGGRFPDGSATLTSLVATPGMANGAGPAPYLTAQSTADIVIPLGEPFTLSLSQQLATGARWTRNGIEVELLPEPVSNDLSKNIDAATLDDHGVWQCVLNNAAGTVTARFHVTVLYNYARWAVANQAGPANADDDEDGILNGFEFLANLNPKTPNVPRSLPVPGMQVINGLPHLSAEVQVSPQAAFQSLSGQLSPNLAQWTGSTPANTEVVETLPDGSKRLRYSYALPSNTPRHFLRMFLQP